MNLKPLAGAAALALIIAAAVLPAQAAAPSIEYSRRRGQRSAKAQITPADPARADPLPRVR